MFARLKFQVYVYIYIYIYIDMPDKFQHALKLEVQQGPCLACQDVPNVAEAQQQPRDCWSGGEGGCWLLVGPTWM